MRRTSKVMVFARIFLFACALVVLLAGRSARADEVDAAVVDAAVDAAIVDAAVALPAPALAVASAVPADVPAPAASSAQPAASASAPAPSASHRTTAPTADVKVRDKVVFTFRAARGERSPTERAKAAQIVIDTLVGHAEQLGDVRFEEGQGTAVVFIGKTPVFTIGQEDVEPSGEASLNVLAATATARMADAVSSERKRSAIATTVFSVSLLVFSALIAFWLLGRASYLFGRFRTWMADNPERVAAIRLGKIEIVSAGAARGGSSIALTLGYRLTQIAIGYAWLIFGLSLFEATRGYTEKLTGLMLTPLYSFAARIGSSLPVIIVLGIGVVAVSVLIRFVGLFFDSVERGDTTINWLARDLARPTSTLLRFAIVVAALVLASPMITGESDGVMTRVGLVVVVAVGLASTPLLASAAVGTIVIYGRRLKKGELVEFGGRSGRVNEVRLFDVRLDDASASEISVPHILSLFHPTRVHRHPPLTSVDVVVDPAAAQADVEKGLLEAARSISARGRVELVYMDGAGAHWRVHSAPNRGEVTLGRAVQDALRKMGVGLGRRGSGEGTART